MIFFESFRKSVGPKASAFWVFALVFMGVGCSSTPPPPVQLSLQLPDTAFCPGGKLAKAGDSPEMVEVFLSLRVPNATRVSWQQEPIKLTMHQEGAPLEILMRKEMKITLEIGEVWQKVPTPFRFPPPEKEGQYVLQLTSRGGPFVNQPIEVWHDSEACPKPGLLERTFASSEGSGEEVPSTVPEKYVPKTPLQVFLKARWSCNADKGVEDLSVDVKVLNPKTSGRSVRGYLPIVRGIEELDGFERVKGKTERGFLIPGTSILYRSHGWIETGTRSVQVSVAAEKGPLAQGVLEVDCAAGKGSRGQGEIPAL